ncbi:MAG: Rpn family recombination-promoting nuclease/putative transposase [Spirulina sp. SIO3F2]|nr:Rpn family recombination-promoting nuclease/putative transposase [Spirulina sp. SIO3F2]
MYDNLCKYLIEQFPEDFATWLLGETIALAELSPKELSNEPIRADSLILLQGPDIILHVEFQTRPDPKMGQRMADYFLRVHRKFPNKRMHQVVVYLQKTNSPLVKENKFKAGKMQHGFNVVRLWEKPIEDFLESPGLLPLALLSQTSDSVEQAEEAQQLEVLRRVAQRIELIPDQETRANLNAATAVFAGLKLKPELVFRILRSKTMEESAVYQEILRQGEQRGIEKGLREGRQKGRQEGRIGILRQIIPFLQGFGVPIEPLLKFVGITLAELNLEEEQAEKD